MLLTVKASPNAPKTLIKRYENGILYVAVAAPAEDGEANKTLLKFLAKTFGVPLSEIKLLSGSTARLKKVKLPLEEIFFLSALDGILK